MNPQLEGIETIEGTDPFDLRKSLHALRLNRFFWNLARPDHRALFSDDPEEAFARAALTDEERDLVRSRDWLGLIRYGVNFARVVRMSNLEVYAAMRGETFEDFMKTRRVPDAR